MKTYLVKFTVEVYEEVEADDEQDAIQQFSEMWNHPRDLVEMGNYTVEDLTA